MLITPLLALPRTDPNEFIRIGGLLIGLIVVFVFGLLDDRFEFRPGLQFVVQAIASLAAIASLILIKRFNNPFTNQEVNLSEIAPWLIVPLSLFWLMGMMNTVNWLDGLDGLAAGIAAIFSAVLFVAMVQDTAIQDPQLRIAPLPLALLGATLGFLPYNFYPARLFMGSSGALTLGLALGCLGIIGGAKMATVLLVLAVPIIDVAWLIVSRLRQGKSPFQGGRDHLHFRLLDLGSSQRQIVIGYYLISALFGGLALIIAFLDFAENKTIEIPATGSISDTITWDGDAAGYPDITQDNIQVILAVFTDTPIESFSDPPTGSPFNAYYSDECAATVPMVYNNPPEVPNIEGPANGRTKVQQNYTMKSVDPDGGDVFYYVDWGDTSNSGWVGPFTSGADAIINHSWSRDGTYFITVKAKDAFGFEGPTAILEVSMPYSDDKSISQFLELLFQRFPNAFPLLRQLLGH